MILIANRDKMDLSVVLGGFFCFLEIPEHDVTAPKASIELG